MAASEVALSLVIIRLHDLLSKSKDIIIYKKLRDQIPDFISNLQTILNTRKHAELNNGHNQETLEGEEQLLLCACNTEKIAHEFLVKSLQDQMSELQECRFTKVFALVRLFSAMNRVCARKKMAQNFMKEVRLLSCKFASSWPPAKEVVLDNQRASSSSSSKRNQENMRQRFESVIVGRDEYVRKLLAWLIDHEDDNDSNLRVISVVGEQASGKTALVRSVISTQKIKHHFDCCAWVHVTGLGEKSDWMKNLLVDILKQTPLRDPAKDLEHKQEEQLFEMLHKSLMELRYLIVLDNLHRASLINELLVPFVDSMNGSRVIVTTPKAEMQKFADPWMPDLRLRPDLSGRECEELLRVSIMGGGHSIDDDLEPKMTILRERILSKCNGPPPAISLLGGLLSTVKVSNWEALINRLGDRPTLDNVMHLSFDQLPHLMKLCVLYMVLFPKESEVPTRRLFRLWAAEGLLAEAADRSVQMPSAEDCFHELESRNLIHVVRQKLDGSARSCRMPAFLHEFFFGKAKDSRLQIQYSCESVPEKESRGMDPVAEQSAQNEQKQVQNTATGHYGYKVQCFQSFALFNIRKLGTQAREIEDLLKVPNPHRRLFLLRVLDLEGVYKPVLPENFGNTLSNLRYLGLRWTVLDSIPESVGNLLLLETLDLKHTNITKVTSAIWNAKNLQHLYLNEASFDKSIPRHIISGKSPNTKLEKLWGLFIETDKSPMKSVLEDQQSLKKLGVTCRPGAVNGVIEQVSKMTSLKSLRLRSRDLFGQPASLDLSITTGRDFLWPKFLSNLYLLGSLSSVQRFPVLPGNLKVLTLSMSELEYDPMPVLGRLNDLIVLRFLAQSYADKRLCCEAGFPKLRVLKLWMLEKLEELDVKEGVMCNLEELDIRHCKNLKKVKGLDHISSLTSVCLTGLNKVLADDLVKREGVPQHTLVKAKESVSEKKERQQEIDKDGRQPRSISFQQ